MTRSTPQLFGGSLRPFPGIPADWSETKRELADEILADVLRTFPEKIAAIDPDGDIEDFWEDACCVSAAWRASGTNLILKSPGTSSDPWTSDELSRRFGPVASAEEGGHHSPDTLIGHPVVLKYGGRGVLLGSIGGDPATDVLSWLASRHRDHGVKLGVVKAATKKGGIWVVELDDDPEVIGRRLLEEMDWGYILLEGATNGVLAQDALKLHWEYRLFVVDGEVVSGAGCVEEFTPLDRNAHSGSFDTRVRRTRGTLDQRDRSPVEDRPDIAKQLIDFGRNVAGQHGGTVVIDVALNADATGADNPNGTPVVIELNGMSNSGLYASNPWVVMAALMTAKDRGYLL
jgi:hypothetical protein